MGSAHTAAVVVVADESERQIRRQIRFKFTTDCRRLIAESGAFNLRCRGVFVYLI